MKFYNTVFLLALLPATVLGQTPGNLYGACAEDSDCRSGLTCYTIAATICLHGETNTNQGCTVASDCGTGFCDLGTPHSGSGSPGTCTGCSDVSDCNGTGGIGGAIGCLTTICLVGSLGDVCATDTDCLSGVCDDDGSGILSCGAPPNTDPCLSVNCGPGGKCFSVSSTEASCRCEDTFEVVLNSKGKPYCDCREGTSFNADANRCFAPPTMAPTKEPTVALTASPTASLSSSPTETKNSCEDDESGTFVLDNNQVAGCAWLTKNSAREETRKSNYCYRHEVKTLCPFTCDFCECVDDSTYSFTLMKTGKTVDCSWLTKNKSKMDQRIANYCTEDFDGGILHDACTKSCGKCLADAA